MTPEKHASFKKWLGLFVTSMALAIIIIDTTVLNVSLKEIVRDLHTDLKTMQWIITTYSLVLAALTITGGRLGDLFGRKKMFILGALLFGLGSLISSFSTSASMLLFGWSIVEGIGAALMMPATASMLVANFQGKERAIAFGVWGGVAGAASAFGPLLGGWLTDNLSWNWAFRINVVIVLLVMAGSFVLKDATDKKEAHTLDWVGSIIAGLSMASIIYGIVESTTYGWWLAKKSWEIAGQAFALGGFSITPIAIAVGLLLLGVFILWENKVNADGKTPLVSLSIFKNLQFVAGILVTTVMALGQSGIVFAIPIFLQSVRGLSAFQTGVALVPMSIAILIMAPLSSLLRKKLSTRDIIQMGLLIMVLGVYYLYLKLGIDVTTSMLAPGMFILGIGMGMTMSQIANVTLSAVDPNIAGEASGINNTMRQLGSSLGSALIGAVFLSVITTNMTLGIQNSQKIPTPMKAAIVKQVEASDSYSFSSSPVQNTGTSKNPQIIALENELVSVKNNATVEGSKQSLVYTMLFTLLSVGVSFLLPRHMKEKEGHKTEGAAPVVH